MTSSLDPLGHTQAKHCCSKKGHVKTITTPCLCLQRRTACIGPFLQEQCLASVCPRMPRPWQLPIVEGKNTCVSTLIKACGHCHHHLDQESPESRCCRPITTTIWRDAICSLLSARNQCNTVADNPPLIALEFGNMCTMQQDLWQFQ